MILICGWCKKNFEITISKGKGDDRNVVVCPHCFRILPSSKKELVENSHGVGRLHIHEEYKNGDIVG